MTSGATIFKGGVENVYIDNTPALPPCCGNDRQRRLRTIFSGGTASGTDVINGGMLTVLAAARTKVQPWAQVAR